MRILDLFLTCKFRLAPALEHWYINSSNGQPYFCKCVLYSRMIFLWPWKVRHKLEQKFKWPWPIFEVTTDQGHYQGHATMKTLHFDSVFWTNGHILTNWHRYMDQWEDFKKWSDFSDLDLIFKVNMVMYMYVYVKPWLHPFFWTHGQVLTKLRQIHNWEDLKNDQILVTLV